MTVCAGTRTNDKPCKARAAASSDYCMWHDPERAGDRWLALARSQQTIEERILEAVRFIENSPKSTRDQLRWAKEATAQIAEQREERHRFLGENARAILRS